MTDAAVPAVRDARLAWLLGGSFLLAHAVLRLAASSVPVTVIPGLSIVLDLLWAAALIVFAFGIRRSGSVVARNPVGVVALVVAGVLPLVSGRLWALLPAASMDPFLSVMIGQSLLVLALAALVVAAVVIGRAGAVPHRVRWVPLIVLAVAAGAQILLQAAVVSTPDLARQPELLTSLFFGAGTLGDLAILLLGLLAIVFAPREPARPAVQVYPPV